MGGLKTNVFPISSLWDNGGWAPFWVEREGVGWGMEKATRCFHQLSRKGSHEIATLAAREPENTRGGLCTNAGRVQARTSPVLRTDFLPGTSGGRARPTWADATPSSPRAGTRRAGWRPVTGLDLPPLGPVWGRGQAEGWVGSAGGQGENLQSRQGRRGKREQEEATSHVSREECGGGGRDHRILRAPRLNAQPRGRQPRKLPWASPCLCRVEGLLNPPQGPHPCSLSPSKVLLEALDRRPSGGADIG